MARDLIPGDATIKAIKPGDARKRLNDGDGLYLLLFVKGGSHGWRLDYAIEGARKTLSLGTDPSDARKASKAQAVQRREADRLADEGLPAADIFESSAKRRPRTMHSPDWRHLSDGDLIALQSIVEGVVTPWIRPAKQLCWSVPPPD